MGPGNGLLPFAFLASATAADSDNDGLDDGVELRWGTDPLSADSDRDGLGDGDELGLPTDPRRRDTDGDLVPDGGEVVVLGTDPRLDTQDCTPWPTAPATSAYFPMGLHAGDIDGDGLSDLLWVTYGGDVYWARNAGGGVFATQLINDSIPYGARSMEAVDIDLDGDTDVLVGAVLGVYLVNNLGGGTFSGARQVTGYLGFYEVLEGMASGDLGGDPSPDAVAYTFSELYVFANPGWPEVYRRGMAAPLTVRVGDLDGDRSEDLLIVDAFTLRMQRRVGSYRFDAPVEIGTGTRILAAVTGDLDGDGDLDIATTNSADVNWYRNGGTGALGPAKRISDTPGLRSATLADLDGDGRLDIVGAGEQIVWFRNLDGRFGNALVIGDQPPGYRPLVAAADLGGSASLVDLVFAQNYGLVLHLNDNGDPDRDGLPLRAETCIAGTDPSRPDSDGGGAYDLEELYRLTDPGDPTDDLLLGLGPPDPGLAGVPNTWRTSGATPGSQVGVLYSLGPGEWRVPGCVALVLPLDRPALLGTAVAAPDGTAEVTVVVPPGAAGREATFIALEQATCTHSMPLSYSFP